MLQSYTKKCRILGKGEKMNEEDEKMLKFLDQMFEFLEKYSKSETAFYSPAIERIGIEMEYLRDRVFLNIGMETWLEKRSRLNKETK